MSGRECCMGIISKRHPRHPSNRYSRMFLDFLHAIINDLDRVASFVFCMRIGNYLARVQPAGRLARTRSCCSSPTARHRCRRRADKADRGLHKPCRKADLVTLLLLAMRASRRVVRAGGCEPAARSSDDISDRCNSSIAVRREFLPALWPQ